MADVTNETGAPASVAPAKKKKGWIAIPIILVILAAAAFAAYWFLVPKTVTIDPNNGAPVTVLKIKRGQTVSEPEAPEKAGADFAGWITPDGNFYDFEKPVKGDLELIASYDEYAIVYYIVDVEVVKSAKVFIGRTAEDIRDVTVPDEYVFEGWEDSGELYDFSKPVTGELILTAKLTRKWVVTFISDGEPYAKALVKNGDCVNAQPGPAFADPNITFVSWVTEEGGDTEFDFTKPITDDTVIYAKLDKQIPVKSITFDKTEYTVEVGKSIHPIITIDPEDTTINLQYLSKDMSIAWLSGANGGTIKGVSVGDVRVFIIPGDDPYGDKACEALVHVVASSIPVESIGFVQTDPYKFTGPGKYYYPSITISPSDATDQSYTLSSSDPNVAYIDSNGLICSKGPGSCVITVTSSNGLTGVRTVIVDGYVLKLTMASNARTYYTADHSSGIPFELLGQSYVNGKLQGTGSYGHESTLVIEEGPTDLLDKEYGYLPSGSYGFRIFAKKDVSELTTVKGHFEYKGEKSASFTVTVEPKLALLSASNKTPYYRNVETFASSSSTMVDANISLQERSVLNGETYISLNQPIDHYEITTGKGNIKDAAYKAVRTVVTVSGKQRIITVYRFSFTDTTLSMYKGYPLVVTFYTKGGQKYTVQFFNNYNK